MNMREWHGKLTLAFSYPNSRGTVLSERRHEGPLLVQKALYPEGPEICHVTILHPPSGIAGGDLLSIDITVQSGAHALLNTPGATRWYKANGKSATQNTNIVVKAGACLDWLPQENIFFEQADAHTSTQVHLHTGARAIGWEIVQLGSIEKSSHWDEGRILLNTVLTLDECPLWQEIGELHADSAVRHNVNGLAGFPVLATLWAFGPAIGRDEADRLSMDLPWQEELRAGLTHMPLSDGQGLSLLRVLGTHAQDVKGLLIALWMQMRPLLLGVQGRHLRLWNT
ncbi:urease accessory protein UreD [Pollutimonas sp. H1-120]|uniref:urease accessory protein UreD n=1 Tax=Pollutimonas sp. H1-120 TaxID=3148824 RepID=UPI003B5256F3